ncbi:maleylpyruvate isomerase N-terminal domain-containing protein [Asanoa sp. NPDC049518]|uniref:maleylpyruvate isomerase N-terminal domain-containing protein n=1 Tax=unclassified Asanoa TaxID=2685164 RepID=UPI00341BADDF
MTDVRAAYVVAARTAAMLLASPAVAAGWDRPSALERYAVSGLAGHLGGQIFFAERALAGPEPGTAPLAILDYYARVAWMTTGHDSPEHVRIRRGSEQAAAAGPADLAARAAAAVDRLPDLFAATPASRLVQLPTWRWTLTFDDFLRSRLVELAVHIDDLAVSVDLPTPPLPPWVTEPVLDLLSRLAVRRHGPVALLRTLSRAERAPDTVAAL